MQLAAPGALGDLRTLVFADHALHLDQERGLRVGAWRRALEEHHLNAELVELLKDQHLIGVGSGEAIRAQAQQSVKRAGLRGVAQSVKRWAVKPRSGVALVHELADHWVTVAGRGGAQQLELRGDRARGLLRVGRDACVKRDPHGPTISTATSARAGPGSLASSSS